MSHTSESHGLLKESKESWVVSNSVGLGWSQEFAFLISAQMMLMLLAWGPLGKRRLSVTGSSSQQTEVVGSCSEWNREEGSSRACPGSTCGGMEAPSGFEVK